MQQQCEHQVVWKYAVPTAIGDNERLMDRLGVRKSGCKGREQQYSRFHRHPLGKSSDDDDLLAYSKSLRQVWNLTSAPQIPTSSSELRS